MNVAREMQEVGFGFNQDGFKLSLKKRADSLIFFIEVVDISGGDATHEAGEPVARVLS